MLMVIFGAGASYDSAQAFRPPGQPMQVAGGGTSSVVFSNVLSTPSDPGGPWRPPLANDLFHDPSHAFGDIVQRYPKLAHILPYLREPSNGRSVEEELELLQEQAGGYPERLRQFASVRYYLRDLLFEVSNQWRERTSGVTNYAPLIDEILRLNKGGQEICLVTFNYDLLLDRALHSFGHRPVKPADQFLAHPILRLFKPHGSVDWVRYVNVKLASQAAAPRTVIEVADTLELTDEYASIGVADEADRWPRAVFPAIAIPFQNKTEDTFACPASHLAYLKERLPSINKILIIGWRAREAHFLEILRKSRLPLLMHLMVVGSNSEDAQTTLEYFVKQIGKQRGADLLGRNCTTGTRGFTEFILRREAEDFLMAQ